MSRQDDQFIAALKQRQVQHATDSLTQPQARDLFEYGRVSGFLQGLAYAETLYLEQLNDESKHK